MYNNNTNNNIEEEDVRGKGAMIFCDDSWGRKPSLTKFVVGSVSFIRVIQRGVDRGLYEPQYSGTCVHRRIHTQLRIIHKYAPETI